MSQSSRRSNNLPLRIISILYESKAPLPLSSIAHQCKTPRQKIDYHLVTMVDRGVILFDNEKKTYRLQPCLRDLSLIEQLAPMIKSLEAAIDVTQTEAPLEEAVFNVLEIYMQLHIVE